MSVIENFYENKWLQDSLRPITKLLGYQNLKIKVKKIKTDGGNYLGELFEVDIIGGTKSELEVNLFVKKRIKLAKVKLVDIKGIYCREVYFYNDLSNIYKDLQNKANVPECERYNMAKVYNGSNSDVIFLENLTKKGYRTYHRLENISYKYAKLAVTQLAKFHGLSFVLKRDFPEYYESKIKSLDTVYDFDEDFEAWIRNLCTGAAKYFDEKIKEKLLNFIPIFLEKFPDYHYISSLKKSVSCLVHGDFKITNTLVKEQDGEPVSVVAVDYQLISYGNPIRDLLFFMYTSTNREFRSKYLSTLKDDYFESLTNFLKYFDIDVENVFPRQDFHNSYNEWIDYGLMMSIQSITFKYPPENGKLDEDVQMLSLAELPFNPDKRFVKMLQDAIDDLTDLGKF